MWWMSVTRHRWPASKKEAPLKRSDGASSELPGAGYRRSWLPPYTCSVVLRASGGKRSGFICQCWSGLSGKRSIRLFDHSCDVMVVARCSVSNSAIGEGTRCQPWSRTCFSDANVAKLSNTESPQNRASARSTNLSHRTFFMLCRVSLRISSIKKQPYTMPL